MDLLLGHLPQGIDESDIEALLSRFSKVTDVKFLNLSDDENAVKPSDYECMVHMEISDPAVGNIITNSVNKMCWKGCMITAHRLLF